MSVHTDSRSLEGFKIFPYIAWGLIVVFALFVYQLSSEVEAMTERLTEAQLEKNDAPLKQERSLGQYGSVGE